MKKLLVTAIGAAIAFGAYADSMRFESEQDGDKTISTLPGGDSYWSEPAGSTNTYTVGAAGTVSAPLSIASESVSPQKALSVKTTFGKPLSLNAVSGGTATNINEGLYFDSLVKFTVCEDTPNESYDGAKIIMWLQEQYGPNETITGTNLMVRAGYLSFDGNNVTAVPTNYVCALPNTFYTTYGGADGWHRVTIKAIADITNARGVPGFAIYLDQNGNTPTSDVNAGDAAKWDGSFPEAELTEAASLLNDGGALFPSLDQTSVNKLSLQSASFDGTGTITDLIFTDDGPAFAKDMASDKATIVNEATGEEITGSPFKSLADAVDAANGLTSGRYTFTLSKGLVLDEPLSFASSANVILDFAGFVLTNASDSVAAISNTGNLTITNSTINVGGIYCADDGAAIYQGAGASLVIAGGNFWGDITAADLAGETITISGGAFAQEGLDLEDLGVEIADGKVVSETQNADGLYEVVDYVPPTYTVTFVSGIAGQITNAYDNLSAGAEMPTPPDASIAGKTYVWYPEVASTVTGDATYTAVYSDINYTIKFVYGLNQEETNTIVTTYYQTVSEPVGTARTGYTLTWTPAIQDWPITVTHDQTYVATYTGKEFTIVTYTNGVFNTSKVFTYAGASVDPADPLYNSTTEEWDGKWYTTDGGSTEFAFDAAGDLTQNAYATITTKGGGGSDWDVDPSAGTGKTAAQEYPALAGTSLAAADAPKLTTWAKANGVTIAQVAEAAAGSTTYDAYLLNCAPTAEAVAAAKAAFAIPAITVSGTTVSITAPAGTYNGNLQMKGSNNLSTWTDIDSTTGYQFFKYELVP